MLLTLIAFYALAVIAVVCVYLAFRMRKPVQTVASISYERKRRAMLSADSAFQQFNRLR